MAVAIRLMAIFLIMLLILPAGASFADDENAESEEPEVLYGVSEVEYLKEEPTDLTDIWYSFLDTKNMAYGWNFPYSDSFFRSSSNKFSISLARGSLGLALSASRYSTDLMDPQYETYLKGAGFENLIAFGYDKPTTKDSLSGVIGMKKIDGSTVIAAVACGQGYGKEWASNVTVGNAERHEGFSNAAGIMESHLAQYIIDNDIKGPKKLWLTGMSRAAAVANLTAADAIESGEYEDVYAYLFGVPRTTKAPVAYSGIYNICGQYDPVTATPFQSWGYERYGIDLYTPAQESDADYLKHAKAAKKVGDQFAKEGFRNNPEVNYQLRMIMETLYDIFQTSEDYEERFQPLLIEAMEHKGEGDMIGILIEAAKKIIPEDPRERADINVFIDYLSYMVGQHIRANQRQINAGNWDPDEALVANLAIEHRPVTYVKWLFADIDPSELFTTGTESRRITFLGDVTVGVKMEDKTGLAIDEKGKVRTNDGSWRADGKELKKVFVMRNGQQTVLNLPADKDYDIYFMGTNEDTLTIFDITVSPQLLRSRSGKMYIGKIHPELYRMKVSANSSPGKPEAVDPEVRKNEHFTGRSFTYSPAAVMKNELEATKGSFISLSRAIDLGIKLLRGLALVSAIWVLIFLVHRYKEKKGHPKYSDWYVIVPHLIYIAVFAAITQYTAFYMFTIGKVRANCALATMIMIALLSLRGAIRARKLRNYIIAVLIAATVPITGMYYQNQMSDSYSVVKMLMFFAMITLLSIVAIMNFRRDDPGKESEET